MDLYLRLDGSEVWRDVPAFSILSHVLRQTRNSARAVSESSTGQLVARGGRIDRPMLRAAVLLARGGSERPKYPRGLFAARCDSVRTLPSARKRFRTPLGGQGVLIDYAGKEENPTSPTRPRVHGSSLRNARAGASGSYWTIFPAGVRESGRIRPIPLEWP
jgi:hypothetical protein